MTRGGKPKDREDGPERKCIATGEVQPKYGMIRFVVGPDAQAVPDIMGKLPGRGMWVSADRAALEQAVKRNPFSRAAKTQLRISADLVGEVEAQLARRVSDLISLMRKSGDAVAGYEKVKDWLIKDQAEVLIQASDGSERGKSKLSTPYGGSFIGWLTANELGMAFGRQKVIHAALGAGGLCSRVVEEAQRLKGVRVNTGGKGRSGK